MQRRGEPASERTSRHTRPVAVFPEYYASLNVALDRRGNTTAAEIVLRSDTRRGRVDTHGSLRDHQGWSGCRRDSDRCMYVTYKLYSNDRRALFFPQILYGLPLPPNKIADLSALWDEVVQYGSTLRILIDHPDQVKFLEAFESQRENPRKWSVFVKVDAGGKCVGFVL